MKRGPILPTAIILLIVCGVPSGRFAAQTTSAATKAEPPRDETKIPHDFDKWESEIAAFEASDKIHPPPREGILFVGSSIIRLWTSLASDFPEHKVINRGFGGSEIADATHFADRIVIPYAPKQVFLRAGGNDIHAGRSPEQVFEDFKEFVERIHRRLPDTEIVYMSVFPAPARWSENDRYRKLNRLVRQFADERSRVSYVETQDMTITADGQPRRELFVEDQLHLNADGYRLLAERVRPHLLPAP